MGLGGRYLDVSGGQTLVISLLFISDLSAFYQLFVVFFTPNLQPISTYYFHPLIPDYSPIVLRLVNRPMRLNARLSPHNNATSKNVP